MTNSFQLTQWFLCLNWGEQVVDYMTWSTTDGRRSKTWQCLDVLPYEYAAERTVIESLLLLYNLKLDREDKLI